MALDEGNASVSDGAKREEIQFSVRHKDQG